jgi:hypothetical protein
MKRISLVAVAVLAVSLVALPRPATAVNLLGATGGLSAGPHWGACYSAGPGTGTGVVTALGVVVGPGVHTVTVTHTFSGGSNCVGGVGTTGDTGLVEYTMTWVRTSGATSTWVVLCEKHLGSSRICVPV